MTTVRGVRSLWRRSDELRLQLLEIEEVRGVAVRTIRSRRLPPGSMAATVAA